MKWVWIGLALFLAWQGFSVYSIWFPSGLCAKDALKCVEPRYNFDRDRFDMCFYVSQSVKAMSKAKLVLEKTNVDLRSAFEVESLQIPLYPNTRSENKTVALIVLFDLARKEGCSAEHFAENAAVSLIHFQPQTMAEERFLVGGNATKKPIFDSSRRHVAHWKHVVKLRIVLDEYRYDPKVLVMEKHSPHAYFDELHLMKRSLSVMSTDPTYPDPKLRIRFLPVSVGVFRLLQQVEGAMQQLKQVGFSESDLDEVLQLMSPDRLYILCLTYAVSFLHALFAGLAFKNDVAFWRNKADLYGMSKRSVIGNAVCSLIIFLFLLDSPGTSMIIIATTGVSALIDLWKTMRVLGFTGPKRDFSEAEKETDVIDKAGMRYLWYILWPLLVGWAIYSLLHHQHRSWYSWLISSLASGVYGFGFLLMFPQIFVNYSLKSVAHLPWRALTYKIFSTFVDDLFAWLIAAPTMHKLATLRDDFVFFVYLYQRFAYKTDLTRPNEFGQKLQTEDEEKKKTN